MEPTSPHGITPSERFDDGPPTVIRNATPERPAMMPTPEIATLSLDEQGSIRDCCRAAERLFGYRRDDLIDRHVSDLLPSLAHVSLTENEHVNPRLAFLSRCVNFDGIRRDGRRFACTLFFNRLNNPNSPPIVVLIRTDDEFVRSRTPSA